MRNFFKFIMKIFKFFVKAVWFCFMFLIVYGLVREQIDKLIEKFRKRKEKEKEDTLSEMVETKGGREKNYDGELKNE